MSDIKINSELVWNGAAATKMFDAANEKALEMSAILVENATVKNLETQVYSKPSPNYTRTGALLQSITRVVEKIRAFVGINASSPASKYGIYVEKGTRRTAANPFLYPAFILNIGKIKAIFSKLYKKVKYVN